MTESKDYEVDRAVDWVAFGAAWYYFLWPEYLIIAWGPTLVTIAVASLGAHVHAAIAWGICTTAVFLLSFAIRWLGIALAALFGCVWGAVAGLLGFFLTGDHWYWGTLAGLVALVIAWGIHRAALVRPS